MLPMPPFQTEDGLHLRQIEAQRRHGFEGPVTRPLNEGLQSLPVPDLTGRYLREFREVRRAASRVRHVMVIAAHQDEFLPRQQRMTALDGVADPGIHVLVRGRIVHVYSTNPPSSAFAAAIISLTTSLPLSSTASITLVLS